MSATASNGSRHDDLSLSEFGSRSVRCTPPRQKTRSTALRPRSAGAESGRHTFGLFLSRSASFESALEVVSDLLCMCAPPRQKSRPHASSFEKNQDPPPPLNGRCDGQGLELCAWARAACCAISLPASSSSTAPHERCLRMQSFLRDSVREVSSLRKSNLHPRMFHKEGQWKNKWAQSGKEREEVAAHPGARLDRNHSLVHEVPIPF